MPRAPAPTLPQRIHTRLRKHFPRPPPPPPPKHSPPPPPNPPHTPPTPPPPTTPPLTPPPPLPHCNQNLIRYRSHRPLQQIPRQPMPQRHDAMFVPPPRPHQQRQHIDGIRRRRGIQHVQNSGLWRGHGAGL